ncbi:MAG: flavodoxin family protein [Candidatus Thorarchaeota archaeon]
MKVVAFNASPRKEKSTTDILMEQFVAGAKDGGADVTKHYVLDLNINGCKGCFTCWWVTPGHCVHHDDMEWVLPQIADADILVLGSPVYGRNVTHYLQRLLERTFSFSLPEMAVQDGETVHPQRMRKIPEGVLISTCGFPDESNFAIVKHLYPGILNILLPAAQILYSDAGQEYLSEFLTLVKEVGSLMARSESIPDETRAALQVQYPDEMKMEIIARHNKYSASRSEN